MSKFKTDGNLQSTSVNNNVPNPSVHRISHLLNLQYSIIDYLKTYKQSILLKDNLFENQDQPENIDKMYELSPLVYKKVLDENVLFVTLANRSPNQNYNASIILEVANTNPVRLLNNQNMVSESKQGLNLDIISKDTFLAISPEFKYDFFNPHLSTGQ